MREYIIRDWKSQPGGQPEPVRPARDEPPVEAEAPPPDPEDSAPDLNAERASGRADPAPRPPAAPRVQRFHTVLRPRAPRRRETAGASPGAPSRKRGGERSFIIRYAGVFVGFFESKEAVTPREAYIRVAQELAEDEGFDPERLELWKPVLLKSARPAKLSVVRGKLARFSWQAKKPVVVQETAEETPPA